jgi:hypothetical protein
MNFSFFFGDTCHVVPYAAINITNKEFLHNSTLWISFIMGYEYIKFRSEYYPPRGNGAFKYLVKSEVKIRGATKPPQPLPPL